MFFPCSRIYKQWVQRVWGEEEVGTAVRGRDGAEKGGKARVFCFTFPITPHPPPDASYPLPVLPPELLTPDLLPLQFLWIRGAPICYCYSEFSLLLFWKEVAPEGGHQVESGMVVRPPGLQLRHLQLHFRDYSSTHNHVIPSIIVKQSYLQKYVSLKARKLGKPEFQESCLFISFDVQSLNVSLKTNWICHPLVLQFSSVCSPSVLGEDPPTLTGFPVALLSHSLVK